MTDNQEAPRLVLKPGDAVFAFHGPLIYEAKVMMVHRINSNLVETLTDKEPVSKYSKLKNLMDIETYYLHYQGWNTKWDEWVGIERILEYNEENIFKKKELEQLTRKKRVTITGPKPTSSLSSTTSISTKKIVKKKKIPTIHLNFQSNLKYILVDDWQFITRDRKLIHLPVSKPVTIILQDYKKFKLSNNNLSLAEIKLVDEVLDGLLIYFDKSLNLILLYKYENLQYLQLLKASKISDSSPPSSIYGVEHFLRLLTSLPGLITQTEMNNVSIGVLIKEIELLLSWINDNLRHYLSEYESTSPQYDSLARS